MHQKHREVTGAVLVGTCGRLLLQQRDTIKGILYPGLVGLFGGHREGNETFLECIRREVHEEIGQLLASERFARIVRYASEHPDGSTLLGEYFVARDICFDALAVTEGSPLIIQQGELAGLLSRMTPSACYVSRIFMLVHASG
jgi:8-oxo-dGTP diphosphatase